MKEFVYFIRNKTTGNIKIGYSNDPLYRAKKLKSEYGEGMEILGAIPGDMTLEKERHVKFRNSWLGYEWFEPTADLLQFASEHPFDPHPRKRTTAEPVTSQEKSIELPKGGFIPLRLEEIPTLTSEQLDAILPNHKQFLRELNRAMDRGKPTEDKPPEDPQQLPLI